MAQNDVRFAVVGFGGWGKFHAQSIAKTDGAELAAVAVKSAASREAACELYPQTDVVADWREVVTRDDIDVIDIVTPSHLHFEIAQAALNAGKHLLLEKPMALTVDDCNRLIHLGKKNDRLLAVGHELRLSSLWGQVKRTIDEGLIGDPQYALIELSRHPYRQGAEGWRYDLERVGNWILEEPIHFFDLARWYLESAGNPEKVYATANARDAERPQLQDNFSAVVHFASGAYAVISQTLAAFEHHQSAKISGTQGAIWVGWSGAMDRTLHPSFFLKVFDGQTVEDRTPEKITGEVFELEDQIAVMVAAVRDGRPLHATGRDGAWSVSMCLAAQHSVDTGLPQPITAIPGR